MPNDKSSNCAVVVVVRGQESRPLHKEYDEPTTGTIAGRGRKREWSAVSWSFCVCTANTIHSAVALRQPIRRETFA